MRRILLLLLLCTLACARASGAPDGCGGGSCYSWNYGTLSEENGWWAKWYPNCTTTMQSPINIDDSTVKKTTETLTIRSADGKPFGYDYVTVTLNGLYNAIEVIVLKKNLLVNFIPEGDHAADKLDAHTLKLDPAASYRCSDIRINFPAEHTVNGTRADLEVRFMFVRQSVGTDEKYGSDDYHVDTHKRIVLVALLNATEGKGDNLEQGLKQLLDTMDTGSSRQTILIPTFDSVYMYNGSLSYPPCVPNVLYLVGTQVLPIKASILQELRALNVSNMGQRATKPLDDRVVKLVKFRVDSIMPQFRTTPSPMRYRMKKGTADYSMILYRSYVLYLSLVNALLLIMLLWLWWERVSFSYRYNLTWRKPTTGQTVFGAAVRYGRETGKVKLREEPQRAGDATSTEPPAADAQQD